MPSDHELVGVFIAIYTARAALIVWIVHVFRKAFHDVVHHGASAGRTGAHR